LHDGGTDGQGQSGEGCLAGAAGAAILAGVNAPVPPDLAGCSPWVRLAKVQEVRGLDGEWLDFDHVFTFVHRGRCEFIFDGLRVRAEAGTALIMPPGVRHVVRSSPGQPAVQHIVHFDLCYDPSRARQERIGMTNLADAARYPHESSPLAGRLPVAQLPQQAAATCRTCFADLRRLALATGPADLLLRQAAMLQLLALVLAHEGGGVRPAPPLRPSKAWRALDRAVGHINACYDDPALDIAAIARASGLSPAYLPELFSTQLGVSVRRYLLHLRVRRARELLRDGVSVTTVAERCGFAGIHAFSRAFRRVTGSPPSAIAAENPEQG
jgi:AraC-like DNA-binding protein